MTKKGRFWILFKICFLLGLFVTPCFAYYVYKVAQDLPPYEALIEYNPDRASYIYDSNGDIMGEIAHEKRIFVDINKIPDNLKNAFIAAEDKTFYQNSGIDLFGLTKAMIRNILITIREPGGRYQGGSTITQQVVRNILLSNERTAKRKIKEMILAYRIGSQVSKDKILEIYLNHIYLGSRSYGVAAAAKEYFNKSINDLTIDEMAVLASLPKAPSAIDPNKSVQKAKVRRDYVLRQMLAENYITDKEYQEAINKNIVVTRKVSKYTGDAFIDYVRASLYQNNITEDQLLKGGYNIATTMKKNWQEIAQNALNKGLIHFDRNIEGYKGPITTIDAKNNWLQNLKNVPTPVKIDKYKLAAVLSFDKNEAIIGLQNGNTGKISVQNIIWAVPEIKGLKPADPDYNKAIASYQITNLLNVGDVIAVSENTSKYYNLEQIPEVDGAVVVLSPKTGTIYALVGGYADIRATFNRAFQAKRQPGSTAKIFSYLAALENNISPAEIFMDSEISYNLGDGAVWSPRNWQRSYQGPVTMRTAFEKSINTVTLRIAEKVGIRNVINNMKKLGAVKGNIEPHLGIALGTVDTTLLNLTKSLAIIANQGQNVNLKAISKIEVDGKNLTLNENPLSEIDESFENDDDILIENLINAIEKESDESQKEDVHLIDERAAYQMLSLMIGAVERGTGSALKNLGIPIAAKTGTSQLGQSLWAIGTTPDVTIGVYVGYDAPKSKDNNIFAAGYAMPILSEIVDKIKPELSHNMFKVPDGIKMIKINKNTGLLTKKPIGKDVIYEVFKDTDHIPNEEQDDIIIQQKSNLVLYNSDDLSGIY